MRKAYITHQNNRSWQCSIDTQIWMRYSNTRVKVSLTIFSYFKTLNMLLQYQEFQDLYDAVAELLADEANRKGKIVK